MKIGFFTDSYLPSLDGVATSVESTAKELQKMGHEVYIIAPNQPHAKDRRYVYRLVSLRIVKTPEIWWALEVPQPSLFKIANLEFDIIHGHSGGPVSFLGWQLARLHNLPFVETYHTLWKYYRHYFIYPELVKLWMIKKFTAFTGNDCDAMITPSVKAKKELLRDGVKKPVYIVPNGIHLENFHNRPKGYLHKIFNIPSNKKILVTVGRLHKEKSIDFLIRAFAEFCKKDDQSVFVIVGKGKSKEALEKLVRFLSIEGRVIFAGPIHYANMPYVYADASLFLFASKTETQGMVVLEALASDTPVIAIEDDAFSEVIQNGKNGYLVQKDKVVFAQKIEAVLHNNDAYMAMRNHAKISASQFSIEYTTRILEQVYQEIIFEKQNEKLTGGNKKLSKLDLKILSFLKKSRTTTKNYTSLSELLGSIKNKTT